MYELARVRLHSVGPPGARYQDVTLDLRHVGAPVARPAQSALFADADSYADAEAGRVRRPSPATVLFLENGGGKSVLIKLIFSVMLPGRRQVVGTTSTRVLEKFVLGGDVAHVALEWQHVRTGQRVVVGKVSQWRDHVPSTDPNRLLDAWYSFRPSPGFSLESLPFAEGGRLVSFAGFRDRLGAAGRGEPKLEVGWETGQQAWTGKLAALGLDPELFSYQRRMNAGEGEAAEAFAFRSDEAFLDWLLTAVTGEEDPRTLGDVVDAYATKLAQRDGLMAERDFVAGALDRLTPLARAAAETAAAREIEREVRREAEAFVAAVTARHVVEERRLVELRADAEQAATDDRAADGDRRRLNEVHLELQRHVAGLRWHAAEAERDRLGRLRDEARQTVTNWQATGVLLQYEQGLQRAGQLRSIVGAQEEKAAPVLAAREKTAARLARGLIATAAAADAEAALLDGQAAGLEEDIGQAESDRDDATRLAEQERARADALDRQVAEAIAAVQAAVQDELLSSADVDVVVAAETARVAAAAAEAAVAGGMAELDRLAGERRRIGGQLDAARRTRDGLVRAAADARRAHEAAAGTAAALTAEPRLGALLGAVGITLDSDTPTLLDLLAEALSTAETERTDLRLQEQADKRVLDALGDAGLLPPGVDLTAALEVLEGAGIAAWSGWHYLGRTPPAERDRMLTAYPHLVDGIVINNPDRMDDAEGLLTDAQLLPRSVVAVGTTADLADLSAPVPAGLGFVVPPNPAMYDEDRAAEERHVILGRQDGRHDRLFQLAGQVETDRRLRQRLEAWQRGHPPGTLDLLRAADERAAGELAAEEAGIGTLTGQVAEVELAEAGVRQALPGLRTTEERARSAADRLAVLAGQAAKVTGWQAASRVALAEVAAHSLDARAHREHVAELRRVQAAATRKADDHRRIAHTCRDELTRVPGGGSVGDDHPVPTATLDTLRDAYETAKDAYAKVAVGADLRAELASAESAEASSRAAVEGIPSPVRVAARSLLATPDAADAAGRAAATGRAERALTDAELTLSDQVQRVGEAKKDYESRLRQEVTLEPYGKPRDIEHGEALVVRARGDWERARRRYDEAHARMERFDGDIATTRQIVEGLDHQLDAMSRVGPAGPGGDAAPFDGTLEDARLRRLDVLRQVDEADDILAGAELAVRRAADDLASYTAADRFSGVDSPVRRQVTAVPRDRLPEYAVDWEAALRPRLRSLDDDLTQINRHRSSIVTRLHGMVDQALATLRAAQRLSRLPSELGDWSGQEFLRIKFADPDRAVLDDRLGEVLDEVVSGTRPLDRSSGRRDGLVLLLKGVRAAMQPKGVRVEMLKPDAVLRTERVRVAEVGDVFSGGQLLTAAIILYCTMAALRANEHGHTRRPHAGVLFLDNPIGRASAGYLLELQLTVAETLGVQLIYTTGLFDTNALSVFPLIIRLRNDADLRANLKYLNVDHTIRAALAELPEADDTGAVTAARVFTRSNLDGGRGS